MPRALTRPQRPSFLTTLHPSSPAGMLGSTSEQQGMARRVVAAVVAGGLVGSLDGGGDGAPTLQRRAAQLNPVPLRDLDMLLTQLCAAMPVVLMPGSGDPTNYVLPQQPLHRALLPGAASFPGSLHRCPNPCEFEVAGVNFVGTSGQNVDDLWRNTAASDRMDLLEALARSRHLAPTAPDTLASYPFYQSDPFVLERAPHVLFAGNQPEFGTRMVEGKRTARLLLHWDVQGCDLCGSCTGPDGQRCLLVAVPRFRTTGTVALVNLRTLEAEAMVIEDLANGPLSMGE